MVLVCSWEFAVQVSVWGAWAEKGTGARGKESCREMPFDTPSPNTLPTRRCLPTMIAADLRASAFGNKSCSWFIKELLTRNLLCWFLQTASSPRLPSLPPGFCAEDPLQARAGGSCALGSVAATTKCGDGCHVLDPVGPSLQPTLSSV